MKRPKKCPRCNSTRISINDKSEFFCKKCGFINTKEKLACFIDFEGASNHSEK